MALPGSNIFQNPAIARYLDYGSNVDITGIPFAKDINLSFEGRTKPVTDISEIAPTKSTQNVLAEGIANAAYRVDNTKTDWTKPFSTIVKGSGQPNIRSDVPTYDYSGYKLGNPEEGWKGMGRELWETAKTVAGGHAPNIIANTLGDYTARYTPKLDPNHPEVMNLYDRYDFVGKMGEGRGSAYEIDINLPPELLAQIKNYPSKREGYQIWKHSTNRQIMNRRKKAMQQEIREAEKREQDYQNMIKKNIPAGSGGISNINIQTAPTGTGGPPSILSRPTPPVTTAKGPPSILSRPKPKPYVSPARPHGNGGGGQKGSAPTGTAGRNPWGRADGGLINFYRYGGFSG